MSKPEFIILVYQDGSQAYFPFDYFELFEAAIKRLRDEIKQAQLN